MDLFPLVSRRFVVGTPTALVAFDYFLDWRTKVAYLSSAAEGGPMPRPCGLDSNLRISFDESSQKVMQGSNEMIRRAVNWLESIGLTNEVEVWGHDAAYFSRYIDADIQDLELDRVIKIKGLKTSRNILPNRAQKTKQSAQKVSVSTKKFKASPWLPRDQIMQFAFDFA